MVPFSPTPAPLLTVKQRQPKYPSEQEKSQTWPKNTHFHCKQNRLLNNLHRFLSGSKHGLKRATFITCQWHVLMKPSFVCLMAPGLHLSLARQCGDTQRSPCRLSFADRGGISPTPRESLLARGELLVAVLPCSLALCTRPAKCFWPGESVPLPPCRSPPMWLGLGV